MLLRLPEERLNSKNSLCFKLIVLVLYLIVLLTYAVAQSEEQVLLTVVAPAVQATVSSYAELIQAVNENGATDITIAEDYKHGTDHVGESLKPKAQIIIHPQGTEQVTLTGRFDIGSGTVTFERINLQGSAASTALWVGGNAVVSVLDVHGGDSVKAIGGCGVEAQSGAQVTVRNAVGGDGKTFGGDGIYASDRAQIRADSACGGNSSSGYGGSGIVCWEATVEVSGDSCGGQGRLCGGPSLLVGLNGKVSVAGNEVDGQKSGTNTIPTQPASYADLLYAIRNRQHDIVLSAKYKHGTSIKFDKPWFVSDNEQVIISSGNKSKNASLKNRVRINSGSFVLQGINITGLKNDTAVCISGTSSLTVTGDCTAASSGIALVAQGESQLNLTGDLSGSVMLSDHAKLTMIGKVQKGNVSSFFLEDQSEAFIIGDCRNGIIASDQSSMSLKGNMTVSSNQNAVAVHDEAYITVEGYVKSSCTSAPAVVADGNGTVIIQGKVAASNRTNAIVAKENAAISVNGDVTGGTTGNALPTVWQQGSRVTITGTVSGAVYTSK